MMKVYKGDWYALRQRLVVLAVVVLTVVLLLCSASQYQRTQASALQQAGQHYKATKQTQQLVEQSRADYLQYFPQYQHWVKTGFVGEERRQQWLEKLRQVRQQYDLFEIDYKLSQQAAYEASFIDKARHHDLYRSVMVVKLGLLHEGDLWHLLTGLSLEVSPFIVRDCEIVRMIDTPSQSDALQTNLKAQCELDWLTLKNTVLKEGS